MSDPDAGNTPAPPEIVAETPDLRVVVVNLAAGQSLPWHYHNEITDKLFCLEGTVVVETRGGKTRAEVKPGESHAVPPGKAHRVSGKNGGACRYLLVQGIGPFDSIPLGD